jgi:outer membrane receptor protein involved in Fe transport
MKKIIYFALLIALLQFNTFSQERRNRGEITFTEISGKVIDSLTNKPVEYSNVIIFRERDSSMVNGSISNEQGDFTIDKIPPGNYYVVVSFIGYERKIIEDIAIRPGTPPVNLGVIGITSASVKLGDVEVAAERDLMLNNLDKKVINVEQNITSAGGSALDVMQNIPSITVDADGNVSMRGNSNITILIDGRPTGLAGISGTDILAQLPASSIESVELVTNPSARYDPEGTAGIINIVLKKRSNTGFNGMVSLNAGTGKKYNSSAGFNYRVNGFNLFTNYDGRINTFSGTGTLNRNSLINNNNFYLNQNQNSLNEMGSHNFNVGADYLVDKLNTLTLNFRFRNFSWDNSSGVNSFYFDDQNNLLNSFSRDTEGDRNMNSFNYTLSYKRDFPEKGRELTADIIYSDNRRIANEEWEQLTHASSFTSRNKSFSENKHKMATAQGNYVHPFAAGRFEAGFKSNIRDLDMLFDYYNFNYSANDWIPDLSLQNYFDYKETIHAAYSIYTGRVSSFRFQAGLRGEQVLTSSALLLTGDEFERNYFSLYPSAFVIYNFSEFSEMRLTYSRRVDRPHPRQLNPYIDFSDSLNISYGNPYLDPQYINSFELGYSDLVAKTSYASTLFYRETKGVIAPISFLRNDGVTETTFQNIASRRNYGIEMNTGSEPFPWWRGNISFSWFRTEFENLQSDNRSSFSWEAKFNSNFIFSKDFSAQITANYNAPTVLAQGSIQEIYFADAALRKDFMNGDLSITLRVSDIFNTRKFNSEIIGDNFVSANYRKMDSRNIFLGVSYRINNFQRQRDRDREIQDTEMEF